MKTAAKVFIIISMICNFWLIYPLVLGLFALKHLDEDESTKDLLVWSILTLIFISPISGILMLCMKDEDLA